MHSNPSPLLMFIYPYPPCQVFFRSPFYLSDDDFNNPEQTSPNCSCARLPCHRRFCRRLVCSLRSATRGSPSPGPRTKCGFLRREFFFRPSSVISRALTFSIPGAPVWRIQNTTQHVESLLPLGSGGARPQALPQVQHDIFQPL